MTWRSAPFDRACDELVAYVRATYAPLGIVVSGSIVRGEGGPNSDLDVFVIHDKPWRLREQKRFAGVPAEIWVNPAERVRKYFENEHARGVPCTAHMFATGEPIEPIDPVIADLVREAREWLLRPVEITDAQLEQQRYVVVNKVDDARDLIDDDAAMATLLLGEAVNGIIAYAFWQRRMFQPRRKASVAALEAVDADAAALVRRWSTTSGRDALAVVESLARHTLGVDTFFEWTSAREPV